MDRRWRNLFRWVSVSGVCALVALLAYDFITFEQSQAEPIPEPVAQTQSPQSQQALSEPTPALMLARYELPPVPEPAEPLQETRQLSDSAVPQIVEAPAEIPALETEEALDTAAVLTPSVEPIQSNSEPEPTIVVQATDALAVRRGGALLRLAEQSDEAFMEIAWPRDSSGRSSLFKVLHDCLGMRVGLLLPNGRVVMEDNQDRGQFSGLVRMSTGQMSKAEEQLLRRLGTAERAQSLRFYPRELDARMFAGIERRTGRSAPRNIYHGIYNFDGTTLSVTDLTDGEDRYTGRILLAKLSDNVCK